MNQCSLFSPVGGHLPASGKLLVCERDQGDEPTHPLEIVDHKASNGGTHQQGN